MTTTFKTHGCVIFVQTTKIGILENKTIHSIVLSFKINPQFDCEQS